MNWSFAAQLPNIDLILLLGILGMGMGNHLSPNDISLYHLMYLMAGLYKYGV